MSSTTPDTLPELVNLSRELARPENDFVIQAEGNTSMWRDADSFWIKASGTPLLLAERQTFLAAALAPVLALVDDGAEDLNILQKQLAETILGAGAGRPSIEVMLHALALTLGGAQVVGHTHPTPLVGLLCSQHGRAALMGGSLFPDEIVVCGAEPVYVPYAAPGLALARATRAALLEHRQHAAAPPKVIYLENHGLIALGQTPGEVLRITAMCAKAARVRLATAGFGGPRFLSAADVANIAGRPDEHYRQRMLDGRP